MKLAWCDRLPVAVPWLWVSPLSVADLSAFLAAELRVKLRVLEEVVGRSAEGVKLNFRHCTAARPGVTHLENNGANKKLNRGCT